MRHPGETVVSVPESSTPLCAGIPPEQGCSSPATVEHLVLFIQYVPMINTNTSPELGGSSSKCQKMMEDQRQGTTVWCHPMLTFLKQKGKKACAGSPLSQVTHTMKLKSLMEVGWLILCDIPMSQLKGRGPNSTWGALKTATRHGVLATKHVSVENLPTALTSGQCDHSSPTEILSKGSQNLSFYLGRNGIMLAVCTK